MRLTNFLRDCFINDVMRGLPSTDHGEKIRKLIFDEAVKALPPAVAALWNDTKLKGFVYTRAVYFEGRSASCPMDNTDGFIVNEHPKLLAKLRELDKAADAQANRDSNLRSRLRAVAYGCSTLEQLREALPEFIAYMPEDEGKAVRTLPVVQGVADEFKRAGWKDRKAA